MHMISKKDLNSAGMDTLTKSCSPTRVIAANGEVQTHEEATVYVKELDFFLTMKVLENTPAVFSQSFAMKTDILTSGSTVKNHISLKTAFEYSATQRTSFRSWFLVYPRVRPQVLTLQPQWHLQDRRAIILHLPQARLHHQPWHLQLCQATVKLEYGETCVGTDSYPVPVSSSNVEEMIERGDSLFAANPSSAAKPTKNPKPNKNENHDIERRDPLCSDMPEWLQEFWENLVHDRVPEHRDSHASSSHEPSLEPTRSVDLGKHSVFSHFPKDRNCEICQRTKITRAPCRRRIGGAVPRAENFGDLTTADHKVLSESCESRNNHRYAIVVQDRATQWIQSYPCKTKNCSGKHKGACKSSWSQIGILKSFTLTIPWNLAKPVKIFPGIIVRRHHTDQKQMALLKEQCAE